MCVFMTILVERDFCGLVLMAGQRIDSRSISHIVQLYDSADSFQCQRCDSMSADLSARIQQEQAIHLPEFQLN